MKFKRHHVPQRGFWAIGLMSGTSLNGLDAALIHTDGKQVFERGPWLLEPMEERMQALLKDAMQGKGDIARIENEFTLKNVDLVKKLLKDAGMKPSDIQVIGFHGQTISHRPSQGVTWQIGNGGLLAHKTGIDVVCDFRRRDVAAGGEGAPLVPLYHAALGRGLELPIAVLNIGGLANVTWIGRSENTGEDLMAHDILAFDTGPGNGLINDWVKHHTGELYDKGGALAFKGKVHPEIVKSYLKIDYFQKTPPKSLDRHDFTLENVEKLSLVDGAATLTALTADTVALAAPHFPYPVRRWLVCGGGRHNIALMEMLKERLKKVEPVESVGWEGDALEAQAFAFLAARSLLRLPLGLPTTTGVGKAVTGGAFYAA